jgi:hypothetical protein
MISDNKHDITWSAEDIQRYWNGQLTPKEMHAMEKAALDDPFLADAMEGMGEALRVHDEQLVNAELKNLHQQFEARRETKRGAAPVRSFKWWQAAAAAVILIVGGFWIFSSKQESNADALAKTTTDTKHREAAVAPALADSGAKQRDIVAADSPASAAATAGADRKDSEELVVTAQNAKKPEAEPGFYKFQTPETKNNSDTAILQGKLQSRSFGVTVTKDEDARRARQLEVPAITKSAPLSSTKFDTVKPVVTEVVQLPTDFYARTNERAKNYDKEVKLQNIVKGVVTDNKNNPLANAFIRLDDKSAYTTDLKGNFNIPVTDTVVQVSVSLPGFTTQNFRLRTDNFDNAGRANLNQNQIQLQPNNALLDEVVVVGYGAQKKASVVKEKKAKDDSEYHRTALVQNANPTYGWLAYEEYLEKNKRIPPENPNLVGEVVLSFAVNKRGELSEFRVEKSLSPQHDAEAQRLVRQGPSWKLQRGRKSRVTVIVRF